jgi:hypothetical protein
MPSAEERENLTTIFGSEPSEEEANLLRKLKTLKTHRETEEISDRELIGKILSLIVEEISLLGECDSTGNMETNSNLRNIEKLIYQFKQEKSS